jgi:ATP-dependent helicase/nuclease subunit A
MSASGRHPVGVVTASAGTGKTYNLTARIEAEIRSGRDPERIVATTFTVKAAEELRERARERLIAGGEAEKAVRLLGARIGTINGVCGGLVKEFAFGLGLSPIVDVIDETVAKAVFRQSSNLAITNHADELALLARVFGYEDGRKPKDWRDDVNKIVELARANNIAAEALPTCADRSLSGFRKLMHDPLPGETADSLDAALNQAIKVVLSRYQSAVVTVKKTIEALDDLRDFAATKPLESVPWQRWAKISKHDVAKGDKENFEPVLKAAAAFSSHPRMFEQVSRYTKGVFACAAEAMRAYYDHKRAWGLVDFVDQDRLALDLLSRPELELQLKERLQSIFVDEFQDISPLQLAVFVGMSKIASSSVWVGDPKQAIYGFRGTDPDLITYVAQNIRKATGGQSETLEKNYRSRPGLVAFFNDAFAATFAATGLPPEATKIRATDRADLPGQKSCLGVWHVPGVIKPRTAAIAGGITEALANGADWAVADGGKARTLTAGDIAILCRSNDACLALAAALAKNGLKVAIERGGLFGTLEGRLALAALRWCADARDTVALAELAHLLSETSDQPGWFQAALTDDKIDALRAFVPIADDLRAVAENGVHKTPLEFLDAVLIRGGVCKAVLRWGSAEDRMLNLEELRGLVANYENERERSRAPTTFTDLCAWLGEQEAMQPPSRVSDAVTVLTYHGSKGLEWPFVILTDLDDDLKGRPFGAHIASDVAASEIDWNDPLAKRWVRFWPWPLGGQAVNVALDAAAANSAEGQASMRAERAERARLLYVGATRARDYLILALPKSKTGWAWLDELTSNAGKPVFVAPAIGDTSVQVSGQTHAVCVFEPVPADETTPTAIVSPVFGGFTAEPVSFASMAIRPSGEDSQDDAQIVEEFDLGARMPFSGGADMNSVGEALHRFLAADDLAKDDAWRSALALRLLKAWGVTALDPRDVVTMGGRFRQFVDAKWPGSVVRREAPVTHRFGHRTLSGRIDAIIETPELLVVVDHKSFPGGRAQWIGQAKKHAGQLRRYREAIAASFETRKPIKLALHQPIAGVVLMVE